MEGPRREDVARIGELTGRRPIRFRRAAGGYTAAERWVVDLEGGPGAFAKIGVDPLTAGWLRQEHRAYAALDGDFMPELRGWDDGERPLLLLEDLSGCFWPPPWDAGKVDQVLEAVARLQAADPAICPPWTLPVRALPDAGTASPRNRRRFCPSVWRPVAGSGTAPRYSPRPPTKR